MNLFKLFTVAVLLTVTNIAKSQCVSPTFDNYTYNVVEIGNQCWFAENLRTTVYSNGDLINEWTYTPSEEPFGATAVYGQGELPLFTCSASPGGCDETVALTTHGRVYNYTAITDSRNVCPVGWHVPSLAEWDTLDIFIYSQISDGTIVADGTGDALKSTNFYPGGEGTDNYGFNALPGGQIAPTNTTTWLHNHNGTSVWFWSTTTYAYGEAVSGKHLDGGDIFLPSSNMIDSGIYIRCLKSTGLPGCNDITACNYNPEADFNDGSCEYPQEGYDCECNQVCWGDFTGDGSRTVDDLLLFLSAYGSTCDELGLSE